ncbi:hypothetical protein [Pandoraea sputorum]|uniref:hypothetical protein n=1 Tax=Pandoraea sputorum TaxID=93222 RepID=UPI002F42773F
MNCDCISKTEKQVGEMFSNELRVEIKATCSGAGFFMRGNALDTCLYTPFSLTGDIKGYKRGREVKMVASFCPFCGESTKPKEENQNA